MRSGLKAVKAASGVVEVDEFVIGFVKHEEQMAALNAHFDNLQRDIDSNEREARRLKLEIEASQSETGSWEHSKLTAKALLQISVSQHRNKIRELKSKLSMLDDQLNLISKTTHRMQASFEAKSFSSSLPEFSLKAADNLPELSEGLLNIEGVVDEIVLYLAIRNSEAIPTHRLIESLKNKPSYTDREPVREVLKLNEMLGTLDEISELPLIKSQIKLKAKNRMNKIASLTVDELPLIHRKKTIFRDKSPFENRRSLLSTHG